MEYGVQEHKLNVRTFLSVTVGCEKKIECFLKRDNSFMVTSKLTLISLEFYQQAQGRNYAGADLNIAIRALYIQ